MTSCRLGPGLGETLSDVFEKREFYSAPRASRWSPASPANPQAQVSSRTSRWLPGMTDSTHRKRSNTAICITPRPAVHGEVGERSFLHFSWLQPPPLAATGGRAQCDAAISSRGMLGLDALIDLQVIHRVLPRRHPEGR